MLTKGPIAAIMILLVTIISHAAGAQTLEETVDYINTKLQDQKQQCNLWGQRSFDLSSLMASLVTIWTPSSSDPNLREHKTIDKVRFHPKESEIKSYQVEGHFGILVQCRAGGSCLRYSSVETLTYAKAEQAVAKYYKTDGCTDAQCCQRKAVSVICRKSKKIQEAGLQVCDMDTAERLSRAFAHLRKVVGTKKELF